MYVAQRPLQAVIIKTRTPVSYEPGDVIPDFEQWDYTAQQANLNLEWVKKVDAPVVETPKETQPKKQRGRHAARA